MVDAEFWLTVGFKCPIFIKQLTLAYCILWRASEKAQTRSTATLYRRVRNSTNESQHWVLTMCQALFWGLRIHYLIHFSRQLYIAGTIIVPRLQMEKTEKQTTWGSERWHHVAKATLGSGEARLEGRLLNSGISNLELVTSIFFNLTTIVILERMLLCRGGLSSVLQDVRQYA